MEETVLEKHLGTAEMSVVEAMKKIDQNTDGILFVVDSERHLLGSLTDGDIRRWIIRTGDLDAGISSAMNQKPKKVEENNREKANDIADRNMIQTVPVVDSENRIVDIVFSASFKAIKSQIKRNRLKDVPVIIMAGGKGTRLEPYTRILPKPLIPIGEVPIMERIIRRFCEYGIRDYYVSVNYKKEMIKSYFRELDPEYRLHYVEESKPLGTAGGIKLLQEELSSPFFVTNCDILIDADYSKIMDYHKESGNTMTVVSSLKTIMVPYGVLETKEQGSIVGMQEKPQLSYLVNTGMYVLNPDCIKRIPENRMYHMTDLATDLMENGEKVGSFPISEDSFLDMGEFEEMQRMENKLRITGSI